MGRIVGELGVVNGCMDVSLGTWIDERMDE